MVTKLFIIKEILLFQKKSHRKAGEGIESGLYPFFTSSQIQKKWCNTADYLSESIILGTGGSPSVHCAKEFSASADTFILCPINQNISAKYVAYFLLGNKHILDKGFQGAGLKHISHTYVEKIEILIPVDKNGLPDIENQNKIVNLLEEANKLKYKRTVANKKMDEIIPAVFNKMFGDPILNQKKWPSQKLIEVCDKKAGIKAGPFGSSLKKDCYTAKGPRVYGQEQVIGGDFEIGNYHISEKKFEEMKAYEVKPGDVLISLVGTIGKVIIVPDNIDRGIINPRLLRIRIRNDVINQYYFSYLLTSNSVIEFFNNVATGITMGVLNAGLLKKLIIPIPPLVLQNEFAKKVKEIEIQKDKQKESSIKIENLFSSILSTL